MDIFSQSYYLLTRSIVAILESARRCATLFAAASDC
jgi:hypothetical protein